MANPNTLKQAARKALPLLFTLLPLITLAQGNSDKKDGKDDKGGEVTTSALPPDGGGTTPTYCNKVTLQLASQSCSQATLQAYPPQGCTFSYTLMGPQSKIATGEIVNFTVTANGTYYLTARNANGTFTSNSVTVSGLQSSTYKPSVTASGPTTFCQGGSVTLTAGATGTYQWYRDGAAISGATGRSLVASSAGGYTVRVTSSGCPATSSAVQVSLYPLPVDASIQASATTICLGESVTISSSGGVGSPSYWASSDGLASWNVFSQSYSGQPSFTHTPAAPGTYYYHVRNRTECGFCWDAGAGCVEQKTVAVQVLGQRSVTVAKREGAGTNLGVSLTASLPGGAEASYTWSPAAGLSSATGATVVARPAFTTTYTVSAGEACTLPATVTVEGINQNYVIENTIQKEGYKKDDQLVGLTERERQQRVTYFDGLGRPMQTVLTQASPLGHDIVTPVTYDALGREEKAYLPYAMGQGGAFRSASVSEQKAFYQPGAAADPTVARTDNPWAVPVYEASPLNRVLEQGAPGDAWQPLSQDVVGSGHTVKSLRRANAAREVRQWQVRVSGACESSVNDNPAGNAVLLNGTSSYLQVGAKAALKIASSTMAVEAWVYPTGPGSNATYGGVLVSKEGEYLITRYPDGAIGWQFANTSPGWAWTKTTAVAPLNSWTHVAVVYDGAQVKTYLNGVLAHTAAASGSIVDQNTAQNDLRIGGRQSTSQYFKGAIDEVRVWSTARSASNVTQGMNEAFGSSESGLAGQWLMSEGQGASVADGSGGGNAATLAGSAAWRLQGFYAPGTLYVAETRDEQDALTVEYTDLQGRVVQKKVQEAATVDSKAEAGFMVTQYVYDDLGNLRLVIQPEGYRSKLPAASSAGTVSLAPASAFVASWCFRYAYDGRRRLVEKQVPGAGPVRMVYNSRDELVLTQDANQRSGAAHRWSFTKYDALGRPVMSGEYTPQGPTGSALNWSQAQAQAAADAASGQHELRASADPGYTLANSFPGVAASDLLAVTYYDDYAHGALAGYGFQQEAGFEETEQNGRVLGQVTGSRTRVLGTNDWITSVTYYDSKYSVIQTLSDNYVGGAVEPGGDRVTTGYDFAGKPLKTLTTHRSGAQAYAVQNDYTYDHAGRVLRTLQRTGSDPAAVAALPAVILSESEYNELGQLVDKGLHSKDEGGSFLQSVDFAYNVRGWLTKINDVSLGRQAGDQQDDLFGFELKYNEGMQLGAAGQFNGNIAEALWSTSAAVRRGYAYAYDKANRLKAGNYKAGNGSGWGSELNNYTVSGLSYDYNGNITALVRYGMRTGDAANPGVARTFGVVDNLTYRYDGNRLATVNDADNTSIYKAGDFRDNGVKLTYNNVAGDTATAEFLYDPNGNLRRDRNKGIHKIVYNALNLPEYIYFKQGGVDRGYIRYVYTASGQKLRKEVYTNGALENTTDYAGTFVYDNSVLQFAHTPEGRALYQPTDGKWRYEYHLKDHLGNLRVSFAEASSTSDGLTMEPMMASTEEAAFDNVAETRHLDRMRSRTGSHAALLGVGRGRPMGPSKRVELHRGDTLKVEVFGMYEAEKKKDIAFSLSSWLASAAMVTAGSAAPGEQGGAKAGKALPYLGVGLALAPQVVQKEKRAPKAYLRYIVYDSDSNYVDSGYQALSGEANQGWEQLEMEYAAEQDGFAEVYLANESQEEAWFDDMTLTVSSPMLLQENHYDPWGLNLVGIEKLGNPDHQYQYNGKEKQTELGLNWMDYGARMYDAQIGRFHIVDPLADLFISETPYHYVHNNPLLFVDPTGMAAQRIQDFDGNWHTITDDDQITIYDANSNGGESDNNGDCCGNQVRGGQTVSNQPGIGFKKSKDGSYTKFNTADGTGDASAVNILTEIAASFSPVGIGFDLYTLFAGKDFSTDQDVSWTWRIAGMLPLASEAKKLQRLHHIFGKSEHALEILVSKFGSQEKALEAIEAAANKAYKEGKLSPNKAGILPSGDNGHIVDVGGIDVRIIGGRVIDDKVVVSTASRRGL